MDLSPAVQAFRRRAPRYTVQPEENICRNLQAFSERQWFQNLVQKVFVDPQFDFQVGGIFPLANLDLALFAGRQAELEKARAWLDELPNCAKSNDEAKSPSEDLAVHVEAQEDEDAADVIPVVSDRTKSAMLFIYASSGCGKSRLAYEVARYLQKCRRGAGTFINITFNSGMDPVEGSSREAQASISCRMLFSWLFGAGKSSRRHFDRFIPLLEAHGAALPTVPEVVELIRAVCSHPLVYLFVDEPAKCPSSDTDIVARLSRLGAMMDEPSSMFAAGFACLYATMRGAVVRASGRALESLDAGPLDQKACDQILQTMLPDATPRDRLLWDACGGHARCLEVAYTTIQAHKTCHGTYEALLDIIVQQVHLRVPSSTACRQLLALSLTGANPALARELSLVPRYTVEEAVADGVVHAALTQSTISVPIRLPAVVLLAMIQVPLRPDTLVVEALSGMLNCRGERHLDGMGGDAFEVFLANYEVLLNLLAAERGVRADGFESLRHRYAAANLQTPEHYTDVDVDEELKWTAGRVVKMEHTMRNTTQRDIPCSSPSITIDPASFPALTANVLHAGANNPGFDLMQLVRTRTAGLYKAVCTEVRFSKEDAKTATYVAEKLSLAQNVWAVSRNRVPNVIRRLCVRNHRSPYFGRNWSDPMFPTSGILIFMTAREQAAAQSGTVVLGREVMMRLLGPLWFLVDMSRSS